MSSLLINIKIDSFESKGLCDKLFNSPQKYNQIVTLNPEIFMKARQNDELKDIINKAEYVLADGYGIVWAAKRHKIPTPEKIAGIDLVYSLLMYANKHGKSIYLLGSTTASVSRAVFKIKNIYRNLQIVGSHNGYFKSGAENDNIVLAIRKANPDILFVGLGAVKQEIWIADNLKKIKTKIAIGVGGSIDILSEQKKRAPSFFLRHNLEWFYRTIFSPLRWWRLFILTNFVFTILFNRNSKNNIAQNAQHKTTG